MGSSWFAGELCRRSQREYLGSHSDAHTAIFAPAFQQRGDRL